MPCCTYGNTGKTVCKCGNDVSPVDIEILKHNVKEDKLKNFDLTKPFYYCDRDFCSIVYFSEEGNILKKDLIK